MMIEGIATATVTAIENDTATRNGIANEAVTIMTRSVKIRSAQIVKNKWFEGMGFRASCSSTSMDRYTP